MDQFDNLDILFFDIIMSFDNQIYDILKEGLKYTFDLTPELIKNGGGKIKGRKDGITKEYDCIYDGAYNRKTNELFLPMFHIWNDFKKREILQNLNKIFGINRTLDKLFKKNPIIIDPKYKKVPSYFYQLITDVYSYNIFSNDEVGVDLFLFINLGISNPIDPKQIMDAFKIYKNSLLNSEGIPRNLGRTTLTQIQPKFKTKTNLKTNKLKHETTLNISAIKQTKNLGRVTNNKTIKHKLRKFNKRKSNKRSSSRKSSKRKSNKKRNSKRKSSKRNSKRKSNKKKENKSH